MLRGHDGLESIIDILLTCFGECLQSTRTAFVSGSVAWIKEFPLLFGREHIIVPAIGTVRRGLAVFLVLVVVTTPSTSTSRVTIHLVSTIRCFVAVALTLEALGHRITLTKSQPGPALIDHESLACNSLVSGGGHL